MSLLKSHALVLLPQQMVEEEIALYNRLMEDLQHLPANIEGPNLSQEVQPNLPLLEDGCTVASPVRCVVNHLHLFSHDRISVGPVHFSHEIQIHAFKMIFFPCQLPAPYTQLPVHFQCNDSTIQVTKYK